MVEKNIEQIWQNLLSEASTRLPQGAADLWLKTCIPVEILGDSLVLDVPNVFVKEQISSRFLKDLTVLVKERGVAGATVSRAVEGYGGSAHLHTSRLLELSENLPVRIEIVDLSERIAPLLGAIEPMIAEGLITISDVHILRFLPDPK